MSKFNAIVRNSLFAVAAIAASVPAFADVAPTVKVSYADLDLSSAAGQRHLHGRLMGAAREVCEGSIAAGTMAHTPQTACVKQAMARADIQFAALVTSSQPRVAVR